MLLHKSFAMKIRCDVYPSIHFLYAVNKELYFTICSEESGGSLVSTGFGIEKAVIKNKPDVCARFVCICFSFY